MMISEKIILCNKCNGKGKIYTDELICYHKREYNTTVSECNNCGGSGRLKEITTVTIEKFIPG